MTAIATEASPGTDALPRARAGDHDAFAELIGDHEAMVYSIAYHMLGERDRAADVAQDVFLQLFRNLGGIDSESHLVHWLRQVATRRCIDLIRRSRMRVVPLDDAGELHSADSHRDPLLRRTLRDAVTTLPESQRAIVTLRYQEGLGPNEISRIVGMRVNTVKSQLHRALRSLRRMLEEGS